MTGRFARSALIAVLAAVAAAPCCRATQVRATGRVCIAAFRVEPPSPARPPDVSPNMSRTTWAPSAKSTFVFRFGKDLKASVRNGEMVTVDGVPADRRVLVGIRLDGRAYESFWLDLRKERRRRVCLWLYEGYWHWVDTGWDKAKGCRCGEAPHDAKR